MNPSVPSLITGGCLCGGVRYEVNFDLDHDFKAKGDSCQCTNCRKQSGSLLVHWHTVKGSEFKWTSKSTLGDYSHTTGTHRFFCRECGGSVGCQHESDDEIIFTVGSVDEGWLIGGASTNSDGKVTDGFGTALANPNGLQLWSVKMIKGVTDTLPGPKREKE